MMAQAHGTPAFLASTRASSTASESEMALVALTSIAQRGTPATSPASFLPRWARRSALGKTGRRASTTWVANRVPAGLVIGLDPCKDRRLYTWWDHSQGRSEEHT